MKVDVLKNGPLMIVGEMEVKRSDGSTEKKDKAAFCRCGASDNKPYCDGTHSKIGFQE